MYLGGVKDDGLNLPFFVFNSLVDFHLAKQKSGLLSGQKFDFGFFERYPGHTDCNGWNLPT
ncbi:hypothetical protein DPMN_092607 [Dreissena polymorpha]|uniref:Uncharacterized protein n=1 Tax=Dreissena polymorpha TaxID=45954 RepID=A0A9D4R073_DREPO|nr:hypothetical protein DPMN_092607 [Dreissena polymorpha]